MTKPDSVPQYVWDQCDEKARAFLIEYEAVHKAARFGFTKDQMLDGTASEAAAYRRNSWMF